MESEVNKPAAKKMISLYPLVPDLSTDDKPENWLTGDWGGYRKELVDNGIIFEGAVTQVLQGNAHGGKNTKGGPNYDGSADYYLKFDTARMNLWPAGLIILHGETIFGRSAGPDVGSICRPNYDALLPHPDDPGLTTLSEWFMLQSVSKYLTFSFGKADPTRLADTNMFANNEKTQFLNLGLRNNPVVFPFAPYTTLHFAAIASPTPWLSITSAVVNTNDKASETGFHTGFHSPEHTTVAQEWDFTVKPFGLLGHQRFGAVWSDKNRYILGQQDPRLGLPRFRFLDLLSKFIGLKNPEERPDDWAVYYNFDQYVFTEKEDPTQGFGFFGRLGWSTGEANPTQTFYSLGVGGKGIIPKRDKDTYGVGYYFFDVSDRLHPYNLSSEQGVEVFYNIEVTPWLHITPDLQIIQNPGGGIGDRDVAIVYGIRMQTSF
jgi:porin